MRFCARLARRIGDGQDGGCDRFGDSERRELQSFASRRRTAQGLAQRARIVLLAAEGMEIVRLTLEATPREATHWSLRSLAKAVGLPTPR
jgi:hypothetical protein